MIEDKKLRENLAATAYFEICSKYKISDGSNHYLKVFELAGF